jgi:hypothetical protein
VLSAVEVENVLDVVAVESAAAVILYGDGPGLSGLWSGGKSTTGSAHADGACNDGGDQQLSCVAGLTIKPTRTRRAFSGRGQIDANGKQVVAASVARYIARISETSEVSVEPSAERHRAAV